MVISIEKKKFYAILTKFPKIEGEFLKEYTEESLRNGENNLRKTVVLKRMRELWNVRLMIKIGESKMVQIYFKDKRIITNKFILQLAAESKYFG